MTAAAALRSLETRPLGAVWLCLAIWAGFVAGFLAWCAAFGQLDRLLDAQAPLGLSTRAHIQLVLGLLIGFLVTTRRRVAAGSWAEVQPLTRHSPEQFAAFLHDESARVARPPRVLDAFAVLTGVAVLLLSTDRQEFASSGMPSATFLWAVAANSVVFVLMARAAHAGLVGRTTERIADAIERVDLLDTRPLRSFGRQGLRVALFWVGGSTIASLLVWNLDRAAPTLAIVAGTLAMASFALLQPVRAIRRRIVAAKGAELERVRVRIRAGQQELRDGGDAAALPALLAWEARVEAVQEWPFDVSTLVRFGALAALATGSWLGGALVERLLDAALG